MAVPSKVEAQTTYKGSKGARTRAQILEAVAQLVSDNSALDVTLQDICNSTDVTVGAFYFHFKNKEAALEEAAIDAIRNYYASLRHIDLEASLNEQLETLMRAFVDNYVLNEAKTRLVRMFVPNNQSVKEIWQTERRALADDLETIVTMARKRDGIDPGMVFFTVEFLLTATEAFLENLYFGSDERLSAAAGAPDLIVKNTCAIWERAILNANRIGDYL